MATRPPIAIPAGVWTEVTVPAAMVNGSRYVVEVVGGPGEAADVAGSNAPAANVKGHPWFPGTSTRLADYRTFTKKDGETWWWRATTGGVQLLVSDL